MISAAHYITESIHEILERKDSEMGIFLLTLSTKYLFSLLLQQKWW